MPRQRVENARADDVHEPDPDIKGNAAGEARRRKSESQGDTWGRELTIRGGGEGNLAHGLWG